MLMPPSNLVNLVVCVVTSFGNSIWVLKIPKTVQNDRSFAPILSQEPVFAVGRLKRNVAAAAHSVAVQARRKTRNGRLLGEDQWRNRPVRQLAAKDSTRYVLSFPAERSAAGFRV
jgi:hypothetical protein